jgi:hypothetical protein
MLNQPDTNPVIDPSITFKEIWDTLSAIDVSDRIKKKNDLSYLSWAWAWQVMMENYPETTYIFHDNEYHPGDTVTVHCTVIINGFSRCMFLPVMTGFTNKAMSKPSARDIGDSKMRCLTKAFAMFGLGHYIYAGEDLPSTNERNRKGNPAKEEAKQEEAKQAVEDASKPAPTDEEMDVHRAVEEVMTVEIAELNNLDGLKMFWRTSAKALKAMEKQDINRYHNVLKLFKEKRETFNV